MSIKKKTDVVNINVNKPGQFFLQRIERANLYANCAYIEKKIMSYFYVNVVWWKKNWVFFPLDRVYPPTIYLTAYNVAFRIQISTLIWSAFQSFCEQALYCFFISHQCEHHCPFITFSICSFSIFLLASGNFTPISSLLTFICFIAESLYAFFFFAPATLSKCIHGT